MESNLQINELPGGQLSLLPDCVDDSMLQAAEYAQGVYSGVQLRGADPLKYETVCALLADGSLSQRQISRLAGISRNLVSAISRNSSDIEPHKQRIAARARNLAALCLERAEEIIQDGGKVALRDLAILAGVAIDKSQLLTGEATARVEHIDGSSGADDFERQFKALQLAEVEELPAMGSAAEEVRAKGPALPVVDPAGDGVQDAAPAVAFDCQASEAP